MSVEGEECVGKVVERKLLSEELCGFWDQKATEVYRFPASPSQRALWYIQRANPDCRAYYLPFAVGVTGLLDTDALTRAFNKLIARHDSLRTFFSEDATGIYQNVIASASITVPVVDVTKEQIWKCLDSWVQTEIDLTSSPLAQLLVLKVSDEDWIVGIRYHHIIIDQYSTEIVADELATAYAAEIDGKKLVLPDLSIDYPDWAVFQNEEKSFEVLEPKLSFWKNRIEESVGCINLPTDFPRGNYQSYSGDEYRHKLSLEISEELKVVARKFKSSPFNLLLLCYAVTLSRYARQETINVGIPFANRNDDQALESTVGLFVNTLPLPCHIDEGSSISELLSSFKQDMSELQSAQDVPFEYVLASVPVLRDASYNPFFQVGFSVQPPPGVLKFAHCLTEPLPIHPGASMYDLQTWVLDHEDGSFEFQIWYDDSLFSRRTVARFVEHMGLFLEQVVSNPSVRVRDIEMISESDRAQIIKWNATEYDFARCSNLSNLVLEGLGTRDPNVPALSGPAGDHLSAQEVQDCARRVANYLIARGVRSSDAVGLLMERRKEIVPAVLGILMIGAKYVPLDPSYPSGLLNFIVADSGVKLVVKDEAVSLEVEHSVKTVNTEDFLEGLSSAKPLREELISQDESLTAYIIYTSGSTGKPKGVEVSHASAINLVHSVILNPGLSPDDVFLSSTTFNFDQSISDLFAPLSAGGRLVVASRDCVMNGQYFGEFVNKNSVTGSQSTPSVWRMLMDSGFEPPRGFKFWVGGEILSEDLVKTLLANDCQVWNLYGPTECTVDSTVYHVTDAADVAIGKPIHNLQCHVLLPNSKEAPIGIPGELVISGAGVAKGYVNNGPLTRERFIECPISGSKAYRSGDLVRLDFEGNLRFLGRADNQVKVRGFRIELGQIEATLLESELVTEIVVTNLKVSETDHRLIAYVVSKQHQIANQLRRFAREHLPDYMVPNLFIFLEEMPKSPSGKVDRKCLPVPYGAEVSGEKENPRTEFEQLVANTWSEFIGIEKVGRGDNFFDIGGHSMLAVQVIAAIRERCDIELPLRDMITRSLAELCEGHDFTVDEGEISGGLGRTLKSIFRR